MSPLHPDEIAELALVLKRDQEARRQRALNCPLADVQQELHRCADRLEQLHARILTKLTPTTARSVERRVEWPPVTRGE